VLLRDSRVLRTRLAAIHYRCSLRGEYPSDVENLSETADDAILYLTLRAQFHASTRSLTRAISCSPHTHTAACRNTFRRLGGAFTVGALPFLRAGDLFSRTLPHTYSDIPACAYR